MEVVVNSDEKLHLIWCVWCGQSSLSPWTYLIYLTLHHNQPNFSTLVNSNRSQKLRYSTLSYFNWFKSTPWQISKTELCNYEKPSKFQLFVNFHKNNDTIFAYVFHRLVDFYHTMFYRNRIFDISKFKTATLYYEHRVVL